MFGFGVDYSGRNRADVGSCASPWHKISYTTSCIVGKAHGQGEQAQPQTIL